MKGLITGFLLIVACLLSHAAPQPAPDAAKPWPFSPVAEPSLPAVEATHRVRNDIDRFILASLESKSLGLAPDAPAHTLVRRLYLDLLGVPPPPHAVESYLNNSDPKAYENLVDRLLADPRYGERWGKFWLDLARYADTAGYEGDPDLPHAWRYRNYVIDAFNQDKPYDRFILEQIAGDELDDIMGAGDLPDPKPEPTVALTFLRLAPFTEPRGDTSRHELLSEMTATVSSVFLGLTVGCAQCHDHKYDRIPMKDFYRMKAFFATVQMPRPLPGDGFQIGGPLPAEFYRPGEKDWAQRLRTEREKALQETKTELAEIDKLEAASKKSQPPSPLPPEKKERQTELKSQARFLQQDLARLQPLAMSLRHSYGPPYEPGVPETHVLARGEWDKPTETVQPGFLSCITGNQTNAAIRLDPFKRWPTRSRRLALAQWIAHKNNPLTARVMANRIWGWHFGTGLVPTPSDFGKLSGGASHPELLDWLARRLVDSNWSVKSLHRLILTSSAWRQSSDPLLTSLLSIDPNNRLLGRYPRRRLEAEAVRDSILAVSGRLNPESYGLPIFPPLPDGVAETIKWNESKWAVQTGPEGRRRSVYIYQQRSLTPPFLQVFDAPVCDASRDRRQHSVTPLQALALYNGAFASDEARHFAARVAAEAGPTPERRLLYAFQLALTRPPQPRELQTLQSLLDSSPPDEALPAACRVLLNSNEFIYIP